MKSIRAAHRTVRNRSSSRCVTACGFSCHLPRWDSRHFPCSPRKAARSVSRRPRPRRRFRKSVSRVRPTGFRTDTTSTATRTDTPLRDIPQFINMVPQALIRSQNATSLADALRNVPGISYAAPRRRHAGEPGLLPARLSAEPGHASSTACAISGEYNRDLFATEAIEVLKGSSALMFGRGSTGGLVNQISKVADPLERREVALTFGSFNQKRATADFNFKTSDDERRAAHRTRRGLGQLPLSAGRRALRLRAELLDQAGQRDRPHALVLLPQGRGRHRLRPARAVHRGHGLLRFSAGVAAPVLRLREPRLREVRDEHRDRDAHASLQRMRCRSATCCAGRTTSANRNRRSPRSPRPTSTAPRSR